MRITSFTDYSFRVLIHTAIRHPQRVTIDEVANSFGISRNHLVKVIHGLSQAGFLATQRGRNGGFFGGNTALQPETADSYTVGFVLQPAALAGFSLTVDYWNIQVDDVISTIPPTITLSECINTGNPVFCDKITRDAQGSLWSSPNGFIESINLNIGGLSTSFRSISTSPK